MKDIRALVCEEPFLPPVDPIQPNRQPQQTPTNSETVRGDKRGGGAGGGGRRGKEEPEPEPEEDQEADAHLDADSFARRRGPKNLDALFADKMPWEQEEDEAKERLETLRQQRLKNQVNQARTGSTRPLGLPPKAPLPPPPTPKVPQGPVGTQGRQVDGRFDDTAAVNSTLAAWQTLRDRQAAEQRQADEREDLRQPLKRSVSGPLLGRAQRVTPPPVEPADPAARPGTERLVPERLTPEPAAGPPGARKPGPPPKVRLPNEVAPMPELFPQEEAPAAKPPLPGRTAPLRPPADGAGRPPGPLSRTQDLSTKAQEPAARPAEPSWTRQAPASQGQELTARGQEPAGRPQEPPGRKPPEGAPRPDAAKPADEPKGRKEPPKPIVPGAKPEPAAPSWMAAAQPAAEPVLDFNDLVAPPAPPPPPAAPPAELTKIVPEAPKGAAPTVKPSASRAGFTYQVIDTASNAPLKGARLELEPTVDDLLPVLNGVADANGWWTDASVPPGEYRITVRHPGYVPSFQLRTLKAGEADSASIYMSKP